MSEIVIIDSKHPAWTAIDDDDWSGATFSNWLGTIGDCDVILRPAKDCDSDLVQRMYNVISRCAKSVNIEVA